MKKEELLIKNKDITDLSNFKTKAQTKFYFELNKPEDIDKLADVYNYGRENNLKVLFIGGGTNLLFAFDFFEGIVIKNNLIGWSFDSEYKLLESYSGEPISDIAKELYDKYDLSLWKRFIGLPGSIGGAVFGNAGCFGLETENNFLEAKALNLQTGKVEIIDKEKMNFSYRSTIIKEKEEYFIVSVKFDLSKKVEKYSSDVDNVYFREVRQPKGNTCGSFFKNHSRELAAGMMIEKVGLKGYKKGGAFFSDKHANFLMSDGSATFTDMLNLIEEAQTKVEKEFGIKIEPEVRIIYN